MTELLPLIKRVEAACKEVAGRTSLEELLADIAPMAAETFRVDVCSLFLLGEDGMLEIASEVHYPNRGVPETVAMGQGIVGWVAKHAEPLSVPDVRVDTRYLRRIEDTRSELAVPLCVEGSIIGVLDLQSRKKAGFEPHVAPLLAMFAGGAAATLARLGGDTELDRELARVTRRMERLELIHRVGMALIEEDLEISMDKVVEMVATTLDYCQTAVLLLDRDLDELCMISAFGYGDVSGLRIPLTKGATGYAARHGEAVNIADVTTDPRYVKGINRGRSELAVPIVHRDEVIGVLDVESCEPGAFGPSDVRLWEVVATYAAAAVRMARHKDTGDTPEKDHGRNPAS